MRGRTVTLKVKYSDFQIVTRRRILPAAIASEDNIREAGIHLLTPLMPPLKGVRLLGLTVSNLEDESMGVAYHSQISLAL